MSRAGGLIGLSARLRRGALLCAALLLMAATPSARGPSALAAGLGLQAHGATPGLSAPPALRVALLGTSLTARGGWDAALAGRLAACLGRPVAALNFGGPGRNSAWGFAQIPAVTAAAADIVVVEFSANDASILKGFSIAQSIANTEAILAGLTAGERPPRTLLMAMNPMHGLRGWTRPWLGRYYDAYGPLAARAGARFVDLRPHWRALGEASLERAIPDGVHPRPEIAAEVIAPPIAEAIAAELGADCAAPAVSVISSQAGTVVPKSL